MAGAALPKALVDLIRTVNNKESIIRMSAKKQYQGINIYDVLSLETGYDRKGYLRATFYIHNIFIGLSLTDIYAFNAGDTHEYLLVKNEYGCAILRSIFMGNAYS